MIIGGRKGAQDGRTKREKTRARSEYDLAVLIYIHALYVPTEAVR